LSGSSLRQLTLEFADSPAGGGESRKEDGSFGRRSLLQRLGVKKRSASTLHRPAADTSRLLEAVAARENLAWALQKVARNKGAPGVDGQSVEQVVRDADILLPKLRHSLLWGTYQPGEIRRAWIPKAGGQRGLGIPNVVDRWVQQALLQVLGPLFEPTFHDSSHGFRPHRGARTAIAEATENLSEGYRYVVDIDLASFFDRVNHQRLQSRLGQRVKDRRILKLIHRMLIAKVVMPDGTRVSSAEGTPQGGPLSPLLANIVLDELDWELNRRGHRFVRYADDCQVYVRSVRSGHRVMASIRRFIEGRLRLQVNVEKSAVDLSCRRQFLGFCLGMTEDGQVRVWLSQRSLDRIYTRVRELTPRTWGRSLGVCTERINTFLRGWMGYFHLCTKETLWMLRNIMARIRRRLRAILIRQKKRPRYLLRALIAHGAPRALATYAATSRCGPWRKSNIPGVTHAYTNGWFAQQLVSLEELWQIYHVMRPPPSRRLIQSTLWEGLGES
jgi:group II intron reverse transcriptase/maturase